MTTWKEAYDMYKKDLEVAKNKKEVRDSAIKRALSRLWNWHQQR